MLQESQQFTYKHEHTTYYLKTTGHPLNNFVGAKS